jgi:hypothetical protein
MRNEHCCVSAPNVKVINPPVNVLDLRIFHFEITLVVFPMFGEEAYRSVAQAGGGGPPTPSAPDATVNGRLA